MPASPACVAAVGVPTYQRPEPLAALLRSLEPSLAAASARLVVADNACTAETRRVVTDFASRWPQTRYLPVPERGVSAARNALVQAFLKDGPPAPWLAMLDDDLTVGPEWLARMLETAERFGADAVGAPCGLAPGPTSFVVGRSIFANRLRRPTGPVETLTATGAILLSRRLLERTATPAFKPAYGLSGGEDYDFFRRAASGGARFAWCDEAFAQEAVDPARAGDGAVLARYLVTGNYMARIDREHDGAGASWTKHGIGLGKAMAAIALGAATLSRERALKGVFGVLFNAGGLLGLGGLELHRYH